MIMQGEVRGVSTKWMVECTGDEGDVAGVANVKTVTNVKNVKNGEIVAKVFDDGLA